MSDSDGDSADDTETAWKEVLPNDDLDVVVFTQKLFKKRFPVETRLDDDTFFAIYLTEQQSRADLIRLAPHAHTREGRFNADYLRKLSRYCQRQRPVVEEIPSRAGGQGYLPAGLAYSASSDDSVTSDEPHQRSPVLGDDLLTPPTSSLPRKCNSTARKRRHSTVRSVFLQMRAYGSLTYAESLPPLQFSSPKRPCHGRKTEAISSVATPSDTLFQIQQMKATLAALESELLLRSDDTSSQWRQNNPSKQPVRQPSFNTGTKAGPSRYREFDSVGAPSSPPRMEDDMVFLGSDVLNGPAIAHGLPSVSSDASFWLSEGDVRPKDQSSRMGEDLAPYDFGAAPYHSCTLHELLANETPEGKANRLVEMFGGAEEEDD
ncbi:hypothetical protein W97_04996 [Coniosporium apollinis CBS 100218]|uniref:Uncharacterized protein n=1 Tax=Coniosporium apollinis (strain CBS 100218) TaxID=1168221 RepID=R7YV21_CONA1|nr:uncharacterized protein W97_04996 [Coniosporium apollinis CBS 100218]EON65757.1 hypothetical protein W97_04996 [Coniosporium apollinis CBS 100218]